MPEVKPPEPTPLQEPGKSAPEPQAQPEEQTPPQGATNLYFYPDHQISVTARTRSEADKKLEAQLNKDNSNG